MNLCILENCTRLHPWAMAWNKPDFSNWPLHHLILVCRALGASSKSVYLVFKWVSCLVCKRENLHVHPLLRVNLQVHSSILKLFLFGIHSNTDVKYIMLQCIMWLSFRKSSIREISSFAPIFLRFNNFRQNIWRFFSAQFHFWYIFGYELNTVNCRWRICNRISFNRSRLQERCE